MTSDRKGILFVVGKGRLDPASHKRVYDLIPPLRRHGYLPSVVATEWEWLWQVRMRIEHGHEGLRRFMWILNAIRLMPRLMQARSALELARFERLARRTGIVIVNQKILDPEWVAALRRSGARLVYDLDDAVWVHDEAGFKAMLALADAVVTGNEYLACYARQSNPRTFVIPTGVRLDRYERAASSSRDGGDRFTIGWIGSPSTVRYLDLLVEPITELARRRPVAVEIVGSGPAALPDFRGAEVRVFPRVPYDPGDFVPRFDVGIMPLVDSEFERGKCGAKALEYMAAGIPTICSPVGVNNHIVEHGVSGFLAGPPEEWVEILDKLASDPSLRRRVGEAGRQRVKRQYSADLVAEMWDKILRALPESRKESVAVADTTVPETGEFQP